MYGAGAASYPATMVRALGSQPECICHPSWKEQECGSRVWPSPSRPRLGLGHRTWKRGSAYPYHAMYGVGFVEEDEEGVIAYVDPEILRRNGLGK